MGPAHPENMDTAAAEEAERQELREHLKAKQDKKAERIEKELKPYRSEAERIALHQRNIQIGLTLVNIAVGLLIAAKTFGII